MKKVLDGDTGKVIWRQGSKGFARDWDGDPTSKMYNVKEMKKKPHHVVHMGHKKKKRSPPSE